MDLGACFHEFRGKVSPDEAGGPGYEDSFSGKHGDFKSPKNRIHDMLKR
jgi:hypothetical protein